MTGRNTFPLLVIVISVLGAVVVTSSTSAAIVYDHGPSASGAGTFTFLNSAEQTELWSFSFEAIANKNGQARGRAEFDDLITQTHTVVRINCLSVHSAFGTDFAVISGWVLHSDNPRLPKRHKVIFAATDGPFLPFTGSDTITPLSVLISVPEADCHNTQPLNILPLENGDIQIQPSAQN